MTLDARRLHGALDIALAALVAAGCSGTGTEGDAAWDTMDDGVDTADGALPDTGTDTGLDTIVDTAPDAVSDTGHDVPEIPLAGAFRIDACEYTVGRFAQFMSANGSNVCPDWSGAPSRCYDFETAGTGGWLVREGDGVFSAAPHYENHPATFSSYWGALAACLWEGKNLCPIDRWIDACGGEGFDWRGLGGCIQGAYDDPLAVASRPDCHMNGVFDIGGNVPEWVDNTSDGGPCMAGGCCSINAPGVGFYSDEQWCGQGLCVGEDLPGVGFTYTGKGGGGAFRCCAGAEEEIVPPVDYPSGHPEVCRTMVLVGG